MPEEIEYRVRDISAAGNRFQNNLVKNLRRLGYDVVVASFIAVPLEAEVREMLEGKKTASTSDEDEHAENLPVRADQENQEEGCNGVDSESAREGFVDCYYICKNSDLRQSLTSYSSLVKRLLPECDRVLCYNIVYAWLGLPKWARKAGKRSIAIIADYSAPESFESLPRKAYALLQQRYMRRFDTVVGLSANIAGRLKPRQKFILMEGGIDREVWDFFAKLEKKGAAPVAVAPSAAPTASELRSAVDDEAKEISVTPEVISDQSETFSAESRKLTFLYSGLLSPVTGVDKLLEAFASLDRTDMRLAISGKGPLLEQAQECEKNDTRICYLGHLPYEQYLNALAEADVLLNPRDMSLPENQNNFPSKIMDYLAAGKPILSTKFVGWEKFAECIDFCENCEEMSKRMEKMCDEKGFEGRSASDVWKRNREFAKSFLWEEQLGRMLV